MRVTPSAAQRVRDVLDRVKAVPGWFFEEDALVFVLLDQLQQRVRLSGHLLEIGAYEGRSAILLGHMRCSGEDLFVCDLFGDTAEESTNQEENVRWYAGLNRARFESNYLAFHRELPRIIQGPSTSLAAMLPPRSFRLIHVDGSHLYEIVRADLALARMLLCDGGLMICDDFRSAHSPGVAAAVWGEVAVGGLVPLCVTDFKFYGTWSPRPGLDGEAVHATLREESGLPVERLTLPHGPLSRVTRLRPPPPPPPSFTRRLVHAAMPPVLLASARALRDWTQSFRLRRRSSS
jgi:Methyltransferase domain